MIATRATCAPTDALHIYLPFISIGYRGRRGNVTMLKRFVRVTCAVMAAVMPSTERLASQADSTPSCKPAGSVMRLSDLPEASGLVASRVTPGRYGRTTTRGSRRFSRSTRKGR